MIVEDIGPSDAYNLNKWRNCVCALNCHVYTCKLYVNYVCWGVFSVILWVKVVALCFYCMASVIGLTFDCNMHIQKKSYNLTKLLVPMLLNILGIVEIHILYSNTRCKNLLVMALMKEIYLM